MAIRAFVIAFVAVQLAVPVAGLWVRGGFPFEPGGDLTDWPHGQIYFTWQMYSTSQTPATYTVVDADGQSHEVNPVAEYGWLAGRSHYTGRTARRLCDDLPDAVEVTHPYVTRECGDG